MTPFKHCIILFSLVFLCVACEEHDPIIDNRMRVGAVLLENNTLVMPENIPEGINPAGVVCYIHGDTAVAVGLHELGTYPFSVDLSTINGTENDINSLAGVENTAALFLDGGCQAAEVAVQNGTNLTGWYLPAAGELRLLAANKVAVENTLRQLGADLLSDEQYVSSTQDGTNSNNTLLYYYAVSMKTGYATSTIKSEPHRVRAMIRIH